MLHSSCVLHLAAVLLVLLSGASEATAAAAAAAVTHAAVLRGARGRTLAQAAAANNAPIIPPLAQPLVGTTGDRVNLPLITDPNGDSVALRWRINDASGAMLRTGAGPLVALTTVPPGTYTIAVTASDGQLQSTGSYALVVESASAAAAAAAAAAAPPPASTAPTAATKETHPPVLPRLSVPLAGPPDGTVTFPEIANPDGGPVNVLWDLRDDVSKRVVKTGTGSTIPLSGLPIGSYTLGITADNGHLAAIGSYPLFVRRMGALPVAKTSSSGDGSEFSEATNQAPLLPAPTTPLTAPSGSRVNLPPATDPEGQPVAVSWQLLQNGRMLRTGIGAVVTTTGLAPGSYSVAVTASDGLLSTKQQYALQVVPASGSSSSSRTAAAAAPAAAPASAPAPNKQAQAASSSLQSKPAPTPAPATSTALKQQQAAAAAKPQKNQPPVLPAQTAPLVGVAGGRVNLPPITDPEGGAVSVNWKLRRNGKGVLRTGAGAVVTLPVSASLPPGNDYYIVVTATDAAGAKATRNYKLTVNSPP